MMCVDLETLQEKIGDWLLKKYDEAWLERPKPPRFRPYVIEVVPRTTWRIFYFDGIALLVKDVTVKAKSVKGKIQVCFKQRIHYCGPVLYKAADGDKIFVELGGRVIGVAATVDELYELLKKISSMVRECEDPDADSGKVAGTIPSMQTLTQIVYSIPWRVEYNDIIDPETGEDRMGIIRRGNEADAKGWEEFQTVLKKVYGQNAMPALANVALYVPAVYAYLFIKEDISLAERNIVYNYGETRLGKSTLFVKLTQSLCDKLKCLNTLYLKIDSGVDTEAQLRALLTLNKLPLVLDDQTVEKLRNSIGLLLAAATGYIAKIHAARYGLGVGATFIPTRVVFVVSNAAPHRLFRHIPPSDAEALSRRMLFIKWEDVKIDGKLAAWLLKEYKMPTMFPFASLVYQSCKELKEAKNLVDLAKRFWRCAAKRFNADYSDYLKALEWVEEEQKEERPKGGEFEELWASVRRVLDHESRLTDIEVLTKLLSNTQYVYYVTHRGPQEEYYDRWAKTCIYHVNFTEADTPAKLLSLVAQCYFGIDTVDALPAYARQFIETVATLMSRGVWPVLKAKTDIIGMPHQLLGKPRITRRVAGKIMHTYDVIGEIIRRIVGGIEVEEFVEEKLEESKEEGGEIDISKEEIEQHHGTSVTTAAPLPPLKHEFDVRNVMTIESGSETVESLETQAVNNVSPAEETQRPPSPLPLGDRGVMMSSLNSLQSTKTEVNNVKKVDKSVEEPIKLSTPNVVDVKRVAEIAAKDAKLQPEALIPVVEKTLQYFDTYPSVGEIRAVIDLERITKADRKAVKTVLDTLVTLKVLQRVDGVYNYLPKTSLW